MRKSARKILAVFSAFYLISFFCFSGIAEDQAKNWLPLQPAKAQNDLHDHLAEAFEVEGSVRILKRGTDSWKDLQKNTVIEAGDQIVTGEKSQARIIYDSHFFNIAVIKEKTKAEFRSIEPTDLHLEDGSVFSVIDRLDGEIYQISTPTAVAAIRGTHLEIGYSAETGAFNAELFPDGGSASHVTITDTEQGVSGGSVELSEGEKLEAESDNVPLDQNLVEEMTAEEINEYSQELEGAFENIDEQQRLEDLSEFEAPADASEFSSDQNETDPSGEEPSAEEAVDQALESEIGEGDLLESPETETAPETSSEGEQLAEGEKSLEGEQSGEEQFTEDLFVEEQFGAEEQTAEESIPEPTDFVSEIQSEGDIASLQDQLTSETAAEIEQEAETQDEEIEDTGTGTGH